MLPIYVVNNFGQTNHLIHRMLRDLEIDAKMVPNTTPPEEVATGCRGIIIGGGPSLERAGNSPDYIDLGLPVLGICLGLHVIAKKRGGEVRSSTRGGYAQISVEILDHDEIFLGYPGTIQVWASHTDEVTAIPEGFSLLAQSAICGVEAMADPDARIYGIQWHPEVSHSIGGCMVYENFNRITLEL
jgi:GMP synthase (glutamine-hydrolysing)